MALNFNTSYTRESGPVGTLSSTNLYKDVRAQGNPAQGVRGDNNLAYVSDVGSDDLVENRITNLLDRQNPYINNARSRGLQGASKRGMLNSSISQGAAERSAIESALPIASADANTMSQTRMLNQTELNKNLMQDRQIQNDVLTAKYNADAAAAGMEGAARQYYNDSEAQRALQLQLQRERLGFEGEQSGLGRQFEDYMARQGYGFDLGRMGTEYGYDLGRMGAGFQYDIGRAGYGADLNDRSAYRDYLNQMSLDNNRSANNRYDAFIAADIGRIDGYDRFLQELIMGDPSIDPNSLDGVYQFISNIGRGGIDSVWSRYMGGG